MLVIDRSVMLTQDGIPVAFGNLQGSFSAHHKCRFIRREMAATQNRGNTRSWRKQEGKRRARKGGRFRGKLGRIADSVSSLPKVPLVAGDDTAPC